MDEAPICAPSCSAFVDETTDNDREEITAPDSSPGNSTRTLYDPPPCSNRYRKKKKKKKKKVITDNAQELIYSSSSCSSLARLIHRGVNCKRRRPKVLLVQPRRVDCDFESVALLLGMSFAAFVSQVLEKQDMSSERMSIDHLSMICTSAIRESLVNVFGDKLDWFLKKFEKSFGSTLRTLRSISESSARTGVNFSSKRKEEKITMDLTLDRKRDGTSSSSLEESSRTNPPVDQLSLIEEVSESVSDPLGRELALCRLTDDVASIAPRPVGCRSNEVSVGTFERSVVEQARSNDLKTLEFGLALRKLKLKETQIAVNCELNNLEKSKLAMGISKASFKAEKFKNQLEDTRHSELLKNCIDCLVAGFLIMSVSLSYGAYVYSYQRISEATSICTPSTQASTAPSSCYGLEILVDAKSHGIFELRVAYVKVSSSSCEPVGVRCDHDSCNSLLATPTLSYFKSGNASYFYRLVAWSSLRFSWEVLHRHTGRKRIALAHVLGDHVLNALMCKSFYINTVYDLTRAGRGFSTEKSSLNLAILDSPCCILHPPDYISAIVVWTDTIC
ncbi:Protein CPR-5, partial [Cucurbita argyrosperma subsp. argyrosperma]